MHRMISVQYGNSVKSQRIICQWSEKFKNGRTSVKHGEETGCQSTSITDADTAHTVENLKKLIFEVLEDLLYSLDLTPSDSPDWSTQRSLKRPSVYHGPATGCNGACVACLSAQNFLF